MREASCPSRRSFFVGALSALAGGWSYAAGGGLTIALLSACGVGDKEEIEKLKIENQKLEIELLRCKNDIANVRVEQLRNDAANVQTKYGGPPRVPRTDASARPSPPCTCVEGDPMCTCL